MYALEDGAPEATISRVLAGICCLAGWVALAFQYVETESVLGTGPIAGVFALLTAVVAYRQKQLLIMLMAIMHLVMITFMFTLVVTLDWSPSEAQEPFFWMTRAYVVGWTLAFVHVLFGVVKKHRAGMSWSRAIGHTSER